MREKEMIQILKSELAPALGCTEPVAIAYAAAKARSVLGVLPEHLSVHVSANMLKNAMGVGIPGTQVVGIEMAAALGAVGGDSNAILEVLAGITAEEIVQAESYARERVTVSRKDTPKKLYIEVAAETSDDTATVIIEDSHTNITRITHGTSVLCDCGGCGDLGESRTGKGILTIDRIYRFICEAETDSLRFLDETIRMNWEIAQEGLSRRYGLSVGKSILESIRTENRKDDVQNYAVAVTAAAADARMSGCTRPVMTICGSGNQGITATLPVIAAGAAMGVDEDMLYHALALSCLVTIHVKQFIGKLSPLCGCGMGSSIGVCCALVYMQGGGFRQIRNAINNMIADVSGIICDGAKPGCALKIATVTASAFQCSMLALKNYGAGATDGIVTEDVENTIRNLGVLGNQGMSDTDRVILDMMVCR